MKKLLTNLLTVMLLFTLASCTSQETRSKTGDESQIVNESKFLIFGRITAIDNRTVSLDEAEWIDSDHEKRAGELGLDTNSFMNGYYIHR